MGGIDVYATGDLLLFPALGRFPAYVSGVDRVYTGWNGQYRIMARSLAGDLMAVVSAPNLERPSDQTEIDAVRALSQESCASPEACEPFITMWDAYRPPQQRPAFSALEVDDRGYLWVAEYDPSGDFFEGWQGGGWHVFPPDGELLGRVAMPPGFKVHEIGGQGARVPRRRHQGTPGRRHQDHR
jgi:hypothetical protein